MILTNLHYKIQQTSSGLLVKPGCQYFVSSTFFLPRVDTGLTQQRSVRNPNYFSVDFKNIEANVSPSNVETDIT